MKKLFLNNSINEIMSKFDKYEEIYYRVVQSFLKKHNFEEEFYRLEESRYIGIGKNRILTRLCLEFLDGSWSETIKFYEKCNRINDEPHYEDLTTTLLIAFVAAFLANIASELGKVTFNAIKKLITKNPNKYEKVKTDVKKNFSISIKYTYLGTVLRQQYRISQNQHDWEHYINYEEYNILLRELRENREEKSKELSKNIPVADEVTKKFQKYCKDYFTDHGFLSDDPVDESFEEITSILEKELKVLLEKEDKEDKEVKDGKIK